MAGSDLFDHKKGSFTGATAARRGLLAEAGQGTVLLKEVYFEAILEAAGGNKREAARLSGLNLSHFYERVKPDE